MKDSNKVKNNLKIRRVIRTRAKIFGTALRPRVAVLKSLKHLSAQVINDDLGKTLVSARDAEIKVKEGAAKALGELLGKKMLEKGIKVCVFDKRHYKYHGLIKEVADGLRASGLQF